MTPRSLYVLCPLLALRSAGAGETASDRLELAAEPPVIPVPATAPGRQFIELPTLEYRFDVQAACTGGRSPRSLSINVADSRVSLSGTDLEARAAGELVLTVPARQLAPIAVDDFCIAAVKAGDEGQDAEASEALPGGAGAAPRRLLTVPAVVSAQASLVCGDENGSNIRYVTQPLAVTLACMAPAAGPTDSAGNAAD